jgi:hypothetical protein
MGNDCCGKIYTNPSPMAFSFTALHRINDSSEARLQEPFRLGDILLDLCKKLDRLHFGIFRAGLAATGKGTCRAYGKGLGIIGFLSTKLLPDCGVELVCLCAGSFFGALYVRMVGQKFFKDPGSIWVGDRRPSSQLGSEAKVI